ncbi:MAG: replicative DNA helicase [Candidatus Bipolaricaulis sp.]|nr:replicative DNA helicase [Candidatus Bipolaricaulis sp.]
MGRPTSRVGPRLGRAGGTVYNARRPAMKQPDVSATSSEGVRELPKNVEAEQQVLGAALLDPDGSVPILIERLTPEHFYLQRHRVLFRTIRELFSRGEPADIIAVANRLDERGDMERAGGRVYLNELLDRVATTASLEYHTDIVRRKAVLRSLIESGGQITELGYDEVSDPDEILDRAESMIFEISASSLDRSYFLVNDFLYEHIGSLEEIHRDPEHQTIRGFSTGFKELDDLTSGLQRSDLIIVAGRPGTGKTSLALSFVRQAAIRDKAAIACFSLEMTKEQLLERLLCGEAKVSLHRLRGGYVPAPKWRDIANAASKFQKSTIVIDDTPGASVLEIRAKARRIASQYGLDMIVVDYLQLVDAGVRTDVREQEIAYISRSMKKLARELNVPVVAVSQLSRAVERRESKRPVLSDLRESGALEQDADVVMFIYREDYYAQPSEAAETSGQGAGAEAEILVAKQRHGPPGTVKVHFNKAYASFYPMTWDEGGSAPF